MVTLDREASRPSHVSLGFALSPEDHFQCLVIFRFNGKRRLIDYDSNLIPIIVPGDDDYENLKRYHPINVSAQLVVEPLDVKTSHVQASCAIH